MTYTLTAYIRDYPLPPHPHPGVKNALPIKSLAAYARETNWPIFSEKGRESNPLSPCFAVPVTTTTIVIKGIKYEWEVSYRLLSVQTSLQK